MKKIDGVDSLTGQSFHLEIDEGILVSKEETEYRNGLPFFSPGLIDVQVNGYLGVDYSSNTLNESDVGIVCSSMRKTGTYQHFPTIVTRPEQTIERNLSIIAKCVHDSSEVASSITGIHVEGPFISPNDGPRGAHEKKYVRNPSIQELDRWIDSSCGLLRIVTLAPEVPGAEKFIEYATSRGIVCSLGHSQSSGSDIDIAQQAGAKACTHIGNGSAKTLDRLDNQIISFLANRRLALTIIADGAHVPERAVRVFSMCRSEDDIVLISDLAPMAGLPRGIMEWDDMKVEIVDDGSVRLLGTPYLAGAGSPLIRNIGNYMKFSGVSLSSAVRACTQNPSRIYGLNPKRLKIDIGDKAEFVLFDFDEENSELKIRDLLN